MPAHSPTQVPNIQAREFSQMDWFDPQQTLVNLRWLELNLQASKLEKLRQSRSIKKLEEGRHAALFAYGLISQVLKHPILLSNTESKDFDAVINWRSDSKNYYYPIQIKELPSHDKNADVSLDDIFDGLEKYSAQDDLSVVICLNRKTRIQLQPLNRESKPRIRELWYLGCTDVYQSKWFLYGSVLELRPRRYDFEYPEGESTISSEDVDRILLQK
jgi:hypothetical protein